MDPIAAGAWVALLGSALGAAGQIFSRPRAENWQDVVKACGAVGGVAGLLLLFTGQFNGPPRPTLPDTIAERPPKPAAIVPPAATPPPPAPAEDSALPQAREQDVGVYLALLTLAPQVTACRLRSATWRTFLEDSAAASVSALSAGDSRGRAGTRAANAAEVRVAQAKRYGEELAVNHGAAACGELRNRPSLRAADMLVTAQAELDAGCACNNAGCRPAPTAAQLDDPPRNVPVPRLPQRARSLSMACLDPQAIR